MSRHRPVAIGALLAAAAVLAAEALPPRGMPENLRGMAPEAREALGEIRKIAEQQRALAQQAPRAKSAEEREAIFRAISENLRKIADLRVRILEHQLARAKARLEWAKPHAAQLRLAQVVLAMKQAGGPPRGPVAPGPNGGPVAEARRKVEEAISRLEALQQRAAKAASDEERRTLRHEIEKELHAVEQQHVAGFEAIVSALEERLAWARRQAANQGPK